MTHPQSSLYHRRAQNDAKTCGVSPFVLSHVWYRADFERGTGIIIRTLCFFFFFPPLCLVYFTTADSSCTCRRVSDLRLGMLNSVR